MARQTRLSHPPGTQIVWADEDGIIHVRNSERLSLARCPQQWWWAWREGLKPKETAKPLWFGEGIHLALAHYYAPGKKRRKDFIDVWREFAKEEAEYIRVNIGGLDEDEWVDAKELGESMLMEYAKEYHGDSDWDVIATEQDFELKIPMFSGDDDRDTDAFKEWVARGMTWDDSWALDYFILNGTFDGVYRDRVSKKIKLMEHKTATSISTAHLPMDNQAGTYWMVAQTVGRHQGWLKKTDNIREITYNFLRKAMPDTRPRNAEGYATNKPLKAHYVDALARIGVEPPKGATIPVMEELSAKRGLTVLGDISKLQPRPLFERHPVRKTPAMRKTQLGRIQHEVQLMTLYVSGWQKVNKHPGRDSCPFCPFKEMCELHESSGDWMEFRDALYRSTDPYANHRKSA